MGETQPSLLYKKDLVTGAEVDAFKKECAYLLVNLVWKILECSPLGSVIVCNAPVLDPRDNLMISMEESEKKMKSILKVDIKPPHKFKASCKCFFFFRRSFKSMHWFSDEIKSMSRHVHWIQ